MADATSQDTSIGQSTPPDVMGPSAPLPQAILTAGAVALVLVAAGTLVLQLIVAMRGGSVTTGCLAAGLTPKITGARGLCNVVETLRSPAETVLLGLALALGGAAIAAGFGTYKRWDTRRKREHAIAGAVLGIQA